MATALFLVLSIGLLAGLFAVYASSERARRRRLRELLVRKPGRTLRQGWSFDPPELEDDAVGATIRSASNSRGWR